MAAKKRAVCVGINDYPGSFNDLNGCVNDARDWAELLGSDFNFADIKLILNEEAKKDTIINALNELITGANSGDIVVFTYSGHGSWVYDKSDSDESDNRDEALCAHDNLILDDELRKIIRQINPEARLTIISDSCHSGTVTRQLLQRSYERDKEAAENAPKPRYMPPIETVDALKTLMLPIRRRCFYPEYDMPEILISGCNATEYSYDAFIGGKYNGAMTAMAIQLMKSDPVQTYRQFHKKLRELIPSTRYPQSPQLEGMDVSKDLALFT